jgi:hypothetical protein
LVGLRWWAPGELADFDIERDNEGEANKPRPSKDGKALQDLEKAAINSMDDLPILKTNSLKKIPGEDDIVDIPPTTAAAKKQVEVQDDSKNQKQGKKKAEDKKKADDDSDDDEESDEEEESYEASEDEDEFRQELLFESDDDRDRGTFVDAHIFWWS